MTRSLLLIGWLVALCLIGCGDHGSDHEGHDHQDHEPSSSDYPLTTCVVSGEALGSMGETVVIEHEGQEVRFCCQGCVGTFRKDPAKFLAKLGQD